LARNDREADLRFWGFGRPASFLIGNVQGKDMLAPNENLTSGEILILSKAIPEQSFYCGADDRVITRLAYSVARGTREQVTGFEQKRQEERGRAHLPHPRAD